MYGPGADRIRITWLTCLVVAWPARGPGTCSVRVTRTARGGPIGVTPSGPGWVPSQADAHDVPSKYSKITPVTSSTSVSPISSPLSGSAESRTPSAVTHDRSCRQSPWPLLESQYVIRRRSRSSISSEAGSSRPVNRT